VVLSPDVDGANVSHAVRQRPHMTVQQRLRTWAFASIPLDGTRVVGDTYEPLVSAPTVIDRGFLDKNLV
jgi:hypothetical protein